MNRQLEDVLLHNTSSEHSNDNNRDVTKLQSTGAAASAGANQFSGVVQKQTLTFWMNSSSSYCKAKKST